MEKQNFKRVGKFEKERSMKKTGLAVLLATLVLVVPHLWAQEKAKSSDVAKPAETEKTMTPLRVQVVFSEYDAEKKVSSSPYTLLVNADDKGPLASVRMGLRVPVEMTSSSSAAKQFQYMDIGTNMDGRAEKADGGRFLLKLNVEKSSLYTQGEGQKGATSGGNEISSAQPVVQQFRSQVNLLIRDGQTIQSTVATDPVTGHTLRVDVTLNAIK
jgi:hypothetical protein